MFIYYVGTSSLFISIFLLSKKKARNKKMVEERMIQDISVK